MNFFAIQLGAIVSLLVIVQHYGQTYADAKPCEGNCPGKPKNYNSGYSKMNPPTLSAPIATATSTASTASSVATSSISGLSGGVIPLSILQSGSDSDVIKALLDIVQQLSINCVQKSQLID